MFLFFFDFTTLEKYSWKEKQECSKRLAHSNFRIMNFWSIRSGAYKSLIRSMHRKIWVICHLFVSSITHVKRTWIKIGIGVGLYYLVGHKDCLGVFTWLHHEEIECTKSRWQSTTVVSVYDGSADDKVCDMPWRVRFHIPNHGLCSYTST